MQLDVFLCLFVACLLGTFAVLELFSPAGALKRKLKRQARLEYRSARGLAHLQLLHKAWQRLWSESRDNDRALEELRSKLVQLDKDVNDQLLSALVRDIVHSRLLEVDGIGPQLQHQIIQQVFRGRLTDLHNAHVVPGIGEYRQAAISHWIHDYQRRIPDLMKQDFPGKAEIMSRYNTRTADIRTEITSREKRQREILQVSGLCRSEYEKLERVSEEDFIRARLDPRYRRPEIEHFVQGAFAEWESVPEWFRRIIETESA